MNAYSPLHLLVLYIIVCETPVLEQIGSSGKEMGFTVISEK